MAELKSFADGLDAEEKEDFNSGQWPKQLGRCGTPGPDEEDQERKQHHLDVFIYYLIYFPTNLP